MTKTITVPTQTVPTQTVPTQSATAEVDGVLDLAMTACTAYGRDDLRDRLEATKSTVTARDAHVIVAGEFKQGKSSLVNALVGASICPVDDDIATAVATFLRLDNPARAEVVFADDINPEIPPTELIGEEVELTDLHQFVTEQRHVEDGVEREVKAVNVWLPRRILSGLALVDTPGVGGLGSAHSTPTMGALPLADAVIFVTDASQEFTGAEIDFLLQARDCCDRIVVALTKIDFYPQWRRIEELNRGHLATAGVEADIITLSAPLRTQAVHTEDTALNDESGYPALVRYLRDNVVERAAAEAAQTAALDVVAVANQIESQFRNEREALVDPERARAIVDELTETQDQTERLRSQAAKWNQTLGDGIADLVADVEHDYRGRTRQLLKQCDAAIDNSDPADTWTEFEPWLYQRVSFDVLENYTYMRGSASSLSGLVAQHFQDVSGEVLDRLAVYNPMPVMAATTVEASVDTDKMGLRASGFTILRGSYMGILMFSMIGSMVGVALGPVAIGIGMVMGRKTLKEEKARQLSNRRLQAKNAIRKYTDEVSFHVNKDSRDTLRRVQRQLRDHYSSRAEELHRSTTEALKAANVAANQLQADRNARLADLDAELSRLGALRTRAEALAPKVTP